MQVQQHPHPPCPPPIPPEKADHRVKITHKGPYRFDVLPTTDEVSFMTILLKQGNLNAAGLWVARGGLGRKFTCTVTTLCVNRRHTQHQEWWLHRVVETFALQILRSGPHVLEMTSVELLHAKVLHDVFGTAYTSSAAVPTYYPYADLARLRAPTTRLVLLKTTVDLRAWRRALNGLRIR